MGRPKGRPKRQPEENRSTWVQIRCTRAFKEELKAMAEEEGKTVSAMIEGWAARERKRRRRKGPPAPR